MDRCAECLLELIAAAVLALPLRPDWYEFVYANAEPAITVHKGNALCVKHVIPLLAAEL